ALGTVGALRAIRARLARCGRGGRRSAGVRAHRSIRRLLSGFAAVGGAVLGGALGSAPRVAITITVPAVAVAIPIAAIATAAVTTIAPRAIGVARMARMLSAAVAPGPTIAARSACRGCRARRRCRLGSHRLARQQSLEARPEANLCRLFVCL